jgi:hypothetical protein
VFSKISVGYEKIPCIVNFKEMGAESANFKIIIQFARQVCDGQNASLGKKEKKDENYSDR